MYLVFVLFGAFLGFIAGVEFWKRKSILGYENGYKEGLYDGYGDAKNGLVYKPMEIDPDSEVYQDIFNGNSTDDTERFADMKREIQKLRVRMGK